MAEHKKSIVLYCDLLHTFEALEDDEAGRLVKHLFRYVNDMNPDAPDRITQIAFEPIKQQLKRDLAKWEGKREKMAYNGTKGGVASGEARRKQKEADEANASILKQKEADEPVNANVSVSVNANVSVIKGEYIRPLNFLKQKIEIDLEAMGLKSGMTVDEFEFCLNQWSLKCEENGWEYSTDEEKDLKKLRAGFEKWLGTWLSKNRKDFEKDKNSKNGNQNIRKGHNISQVVSAAEEILRQHSSEKHN